MHQKSGKSMEDYLHAYLKGYDEKSEIKYKNITRYLFSKNMLFPLEWYN